MQVSEYLGNKKNQDFLIKISKIIILGFVSFSLLSSAIPFYLGFDDVNYGILSINLSEGRYRLTNDLLQETGQSQFFPRAYVVTPDNSTVSKSSPGIFTLGAISYLVGGFSGLFYLGPIVTILLFISFERISTKLFGNLAGLLALLLLASDWQIYFIGLRLLTDNIFALFFILGVFSLIKFLHNKNDNYILFSSIFFTCSAFLRINGIVFFPTEILILLGYFVSQRLDTNKIFNKSNPRMVLKNKLISKSNFKKFLKISFYLMIPWLVFLAFWFSYNDYYFGDATTNYQEQVRSGSIDEEEESLALSTSSNIPESEQISNNPFERAKLIQYYSVPILPDPLYFFLIITSDTDLDGWRTDIWISYVTFSSLSIVLIFSLYFKIKRKEILTLLLFVVALVGFYASPLVANHPLAPNLSESANNRYMIPASILSFMLIGFIFIGIWHEIFHRNPKRYRKIMNSFKLIYLLLVIIFFSVLIFVMPSIQDFYQRGFHFNNPLEYSISYENLEQLPEKSFTIGIDGRNTLLHTDTHYYPYRFDFEGDPDTVPTHKIETLKRILGEGYTGFAFKAMYQNDQNYFKFLEEEHGIILKDYSDTFCKLELISDTQKDNDIGSDPICFNYIQEKREKIWNVSLRWPS